MRIAIADSNDDTRGRAKRLWITLLRCNKGVRFAHDAFDWEGCSSPLPNPPHEVRYRQQPRERSATRLPKTQKTVSRKEFERTATTGTVGDDRPKRHQRGKGRTAISFDAPLETASKMLQRYEGRGKIEPFDPSLEQDLSGPIKRLIRTGSALSNPPGCNPVPNIPRRCPENRLKGRFRAFSDLAGTLGLDSRVARSEAVFAAF